MRLSGACPKNKPTDKQKRPELDDMNANRTQPITQLKDQALTLRIKILCIGNGVTLLVLKEKDTNWNVCFQPCLFWYSYIKLCTTNCP